MNSPIKYRGCLPRSSVAVYGYLIEKRCRQFYIYEPETHAYIRVSSRHLCLFTGVRDVNGIELYEEDHVRRETDGLVYQIQYHYAGFWLVGTGLRLPIVEGMRLTKIEEDALGYM